MPKIKNDGLGPARYTYLPEDVDRWLQGQSVELERPMAWVIRQAVIEKYEREVAARSEARNGHRSSRAVAR